MKTQTTGIVIGVLVIALLISGFVPYITALHAIETPYVTNATSTNENTATSVETLPSTTTSTTVVTEQSVQTVSQQVYNINAYTINCSSWVYASASLTTQESVTIMFNAGDTVDAYLMNVNQYTAYTGGSTSNYVASLEGQSSGMFGYIVPVSGTYYIVVYNPHTGLFCVGGEKVTVNSLTGTATLQQTVNYFVTQTGTEVAYFTTTQTIVLTSDSTYTTTLTSTSTMTCTQGWLQAIFGCG